MVAAISKAFLVTSLPDGNSTLKVSESVKVSSQHPLHFLAICPTDDPVSSSIWNIFWRENSNFLLLKIQKSHLERDISATTSTRTTRSTDSKQFQIMPILDLKFHISKTSIWHFTDSPNHLFFMFDFHQLSPIRITSSTTAVLASQRSVKIQKDLSISIFKGHFEVSTIATIHSGATVRLFFHDKKYSSVLIEYIVSIFVFPPTRNFQKPKLKFENQKVQVKQFE